MWETFPYPLEERSPEDQLKDETENEEKHQLKDETENEEKHEEEAAAADVNPSNDHDEEKPSISEAEGVAKI